MIFILYLLLFFYAIACLILISMILLQSGKGGGLSSLGAANQGLADALGSTGAERTLTTWTTRAAVSFFILALVISIVSTKAFHAPRIGQGASNSPVPTGTVPGAATAPGGPAAPDANVPSAPSAPAPAAPAQ